MAVSKVILNGNTLIDTTQKTVTASKMLSGETALNNAGEDITGNIATKTSSNLTVSGATVTAPAGYYASNASKSVASGSATPAATISATGASVSTGTNTLTLSKTVSNTPTVTSGYVSSGTAGNSSVSLTASVTTQAAQTIHPSTSDQTIASGRYLTGAQTVKAVQLTNLSPSNIVSGVTVKVGDSTDDDCVTSVTGTASSGGSTATLIYEGTLTNTSTSSTTEALAETINLGTTDAWTYEKILYITIQKITDWNPSGTRPSSDGEMGSETFCLGPGAWAERYDDGGTTYTFPSREVQSYYYANGRFSTDSGIRGVYPKSLTKAGALSIYKRKASSGYTFDISGTFKIWVYLLDYPEGTPFVKRT